MKSHRPASRMPQLVALGFLASGMSMAASMMDSVPSFEVVRSRLDLTPEQARQISPLIQKRQVELQQTREKLETATSRAEWQAVLREAQAEGDAFSAAVEKLLSTSQVPEWRELRKDTREKIRDRYEEDRDAG